MQLHSFFFSYFPIIFIFCETFHGSLLKKNEYEADAYACKFTPAKDLKESLLKLYRDNASTLTPDKLYSNFYDSHPPAMSRIKALVTK